GLSDNSYPLGAVGFLRPSYLIGSMLGQIGDGGPPASTGDPDAEAQLIVTGVVKSALDGKPVAGAAVGLLPPGTREASARNILTWGYTDPEGRFRLNRVIRPGRYTVQAKTFGYEIFKRDVELSRQNTQLTIELRRSE